MKNLSAIFFFAILLAALTSTAFSQKRIEATPVLSFDHLKAGDSNVPLTFRIENRSDIKLENVHARLMLSHPFSPSILSRKELRSDMYRLDDLEKKVSKNAYFKIDVSGDAKYGDYPLQLVVSYDDPSDPMFRTEETFPFILHVTGETLLAIKDVSIAPDMEITPGEHFSIIVRVKNVGDNEIKWLKVAVALPQEIISISPDQRIFEDILKGKIVEADYVFTTEKNSSPANHAIQMILEYKDETEKIHNEKRAVGVEIKGEAKVDVASVATNPAEPKAGDPLTLTIRIENAGTTEAKSVKATISLPFSGTREAFLGMIKKDEDAPAVFTLKSGAPGEYKYNLSIEYEDDLGIHTKTQELTFMVNPKMDNDFILGGAGFAAVILALIVVFVSYLLIKKRR